MSDTPEPTQAAEVPPEPAPDNELPPATEPAASEPPAPSAAELVAAPAGAAPIAETPDDRRRRRWRIALLLLLIGVALSLAIFTAWYLLFHKPISEFPLPNIVTQAMPGYEYSLYGIGRPTGIAVASDGSRIYVTQTEGSTAVMVFDGHGNQVATLTPPDTGTDHVFVYVAIDPLSGDVYVSDRPTASIYVYSADGTYLRTFDAPAGLAGWQPLGLSFDPAGQMLVTDAVRGQVDEFGTDGVLVRTIGQANQFNFPNAAVFDQDQRLYVSDSNNGRLIVLDQSGNQLAVVRRGPGDGDLGLPRGLAIDDESRLYVVDTTDQSVKVYSADGADAQPAFLGSFGTEGSGDGAFSFPNAVATDNHGRVYVADWNNDRVQVWSY